MLFFNVYHIPVLAQCFFFHEYFWINQFILFTFIKCDKIYFSRFYSSVKIKVVNEHFTNKRYQIWETHHSCFELKLHNMTICKSAFFFPHSLSPIFNGWKVASFYYDRRQLLRVSYKMLLQSGTSCFFAKCF